MTGWVKVMLTFCVTVRPLPLMSEPSEPVKVNDAVLPGAQAEPPPGSKRDGQRIVDGSHCGCQVWLRQQFSV